MKKLSLLLQSNKTYLVLFIILFIYVILFTKIIKYNSVYNGNETLITGIVISYKYDNDRLSLTIHGKENIIANYYKKNLQINTSELLGSRVKLRGELLEPLNNTVPNTFNYKKYLNHKKIYYIFKVKELNYKKSSNILYIIKNKLYCRINVDNKTNEYLNMFILGNKNMIDKDKYNEYLNNGVVHLFAISGMHLAVLIVILNKFLKFKHNKGIILLFLWFYAFIVSFAMSVMRALIFFTINEFLRVCNIKVDNIKILYLTAFIILLINPFAIYDIGFLYSFVTVFSIFFYKDKITGSYILKSLKISCITFIYTMPITINLNYDINFLSILNNLIFIPFVSFVIYPFSIIVYIIPYLTNFYAFLITLMENFNSVINDFTFFKIVIPKLNPIIICIYYLVLLTKRTKLYLINILLIFMYLKLIIYSDTNYYIYYLDVGQGDSALLIGPRRDEVVMIDTGGEILTAKNSYHKSDNTIKLLKSLGIDNIDLMIISHGDADHANESFNIFNKIKVKNVIINNNSLNKIEKQIVMSANNIKNYNSKDFIINNYNKYIKNDENYSSIITKVKIKKLKFLFMGDAPKEIEKKLINDINLKSDFLKLGHHGSKTSSDRDFLEKVNPDYAIISSGRNNLFHHPSRETIENLNNLKIKYFNTQTSGTILIKINKNHCTIKEYKP